GTFDAAVSVTWSWLERVPEGADPLALHVRSIVDVGAEVPFGVAASALAGVGVCRDALAQELLDAIARGDLGRVVEAPVEECLVPAGTTAVCAVQPLTSEVHVASSGDRARVVLVERQPRDASGPTVVPLAEALAADDSPLCLVFPTTRAREEASAGACIVATLRARAAEDPEAAARRRAEVAAAKPAPPPPTPRAQALAAAGLALADPRARRTALLQLARDGGAALARDVALFAEEELLAELAADLAAFLAEQAEPPDATAVGVALEQMVLRRLAALRERDALAPELAAAAERCHGQAARTRSPPPRGAAACTSAEALQAWARAENLLALEDPQPAVRVRAFTWLQRTGGAPPGYDPLAGRKERRAALAQFGEGAR